MLRSLIWYVGFAASLVKKIPLMLRYNRLVTEYPPEHYADKLDDLVRKWALANVKRSGATFKIQGIENVPEDGPVLYVSNHQSDFDIAVFMCFLPKAKGYVSKVQLLTVPLLRTWMKHLRCVFLDRDDMKKSAKAIIEAITILKSGYSMVVFPEGTRSKNGQIGEFKAGSFKLATKAKVPIVPVTIKGTRNIMEANNYFIKPAEVEIIVHPAVYTKNLTKEEEIALPARIWDMIAS